MIRPVQPQDVKYITDIYNEYILNSTYTFETEPISEDEMRLRIAEIFPHFPFFVCETTDGLPIYPRNDSIPVCPT